MGRLLLLGFAQHDSASENSHCWPAGAGRRGYRQRISAKPRRANHSQRDIPGKLEYQRWADLVLWDQPGAAQYDTAVYKYF